MLRLGHGEEELNTDQNFGKFGRVNSFLERRIFLLQEVDRLSQSLNIEGAHGSTCETAGYFYNIHVLPIWTSYIASAREAGSAKALQQNFPFVAFFATAPQPLFTAEMSFDDSLSIAEGCFRHLEKIFTELEDIRPFELLRTGTDRANYLLTKEAKIIAMTCTHAALKVTTKSLLDCCYNLSLYTNISFYSAGSLLDLSSSTIMLSLRNLRKSWK